MSALAFIAGLAIGGCVGLFVMAALCAGRTR